MWAVALTMESMFEDDISILTQEALGPSEVWLDGPGDPSLGGDMCSASHFALITAYGDIKERLGGLERENATLRRRLKVYEVKVSIWRQEGSGVGCGRMVAGTGCPVEIPGIQKRDWGAVFSERCDPAANHEGSALEWWILSERGRGN